MGRSESSAGADSLNSVENILKHYGVKGMKWGSRLSRKPKETPSADAARALLLRDRAKRSKPRALSNAELQEAINRMNLEQQFKRLSTNERNVASRFIANTLLEAGKREVTSVVAKKAAKLVTKAAI